MKDFTRQELIELFDLKYRGSGALGVSPARRLRFDYFNPDDHYEALARRLVRAETRWLDVGCGRDLFPSNHTLARELSKRCALLVGVDPDATILENAYVHEKVQGVIQDLPADARFDLVTFRMVAEHIAEPQTLLKALGRLVVPGGLVVIYTVNRWSPVPLITAMTPFDLHQPVKRFLWRTEPKDTFPTTFKMNTRHELNRLFSANGFEERAFWFLDDCRSLARFRVTNLMELSVRTMLHRWGMRYPENCLLGVYARCSKAELPG